MTAPVASHRKTRQNPLAAFVLPGGTRTTRTARTAATLALAGAATATVFDGTGQAASGTTPAQVKDRVDALYQEAEVATQKYDGAKEQADTARKELSTLQDEAARRTGELNAARADLGTMAATEYRSGGVDPTVRLMMSADPQRYLDGATVLERAGSHQAGAVAGYARRLGRVRQVRERAEATAERLEHNETALRKHRVTVVRKLRSAEQLLDRLTDEQRRRMAREDGSADVGPAREGRAPGLPRASAQAPNSRAAQAVSFAYAALGKPYVWGATGPSAYDCSGLTQAAWKSSGISLPRTTYTQINSGPRIDRSQLAPGDLVFFYTGISHVGLYIGDGKMIHAPHPGAPVRIAPIDQMPFAGATRPAA
ncbi:NlpC/P60 family protein [Streptomyces piniterrae]|uniref:NlpC/P60 family protein n=1 Tax=Streptomyces piniterrae TaxID=2571125 RepID=A0A4U0NFQ6_9ACTN|nr:NlpC/P60 family protein [Streptomyces piniterrae]TJZ52971.1 NlpC/P60 family protein [Streptomyces piniterrae]